SPRARRREGQRSRAGRCRFRQAFGPLDARPDRPAWPDGRAGGPVDPRRGLRDPDRCRWAVRASRGQSDDLGQRIPRQRPHAGSARPPDARRAEPHGDLRFAPGAGGDAGGGTGEIRQPGAGRRPGGPDRAIGAGRRAVAALGLPGHQAAAQRGAFQPQRPPLRHLLRIRRVTLAARLSGWLVCGLAALALPGAAWADDTDAKGLHAGPHTEIAPYIEADQVVTAEIDPGSDVVTYSTLAAGADATIVGHYSAASASVRYERHFSESRGLADSDTVSGIARASYAIVPRAVTIEAGALASREGVDGSGGTFAGALVGDSGVASTIYSGYIG